MVTWATVVNPEPKQPWSPQLDCPESEGIEKDVPAYGPPQDLKRLSPLDQIAFSRPWPFPHSYSKSSAHKEGGHYGLEDVKGHGILQASQCCSAYLQPPASDSTRLQMTAPKRGLIWRTWDLFGVGK